MTRKEEKEHYSYLYKNKYDGLEECYQPTLESAYEAGWEAADEHPISGEQIAAMKNEIKFLKRKLVECDKMYCELQNKNPWVSVDERLPETKECVTPIERSDLVLIRRKGDRYPMRAWYWNDGKFTTPDVDETPKNSISEIDKSEVKAWMPIPEGGEE